MNNLRRYKNFLLERKNRFSGTTYDNRVNDYKGMSKDPKILSAVGGFFQKMEDRFNAMSGNLQQQAELTRGQRGPSTFNTGYELLYELPSVVPGVLKRIFGGTTYGYDDVFKNEEDVPLEFMKHINDRWATKELPGIRSEEELYKNIEGLYKKGGVSPGQSPILDDIVMNRFNTYLQRRRS